MLIYTVKTPAIFRFNGVDVHWRRGQTIEDGHPILKGREHMVEPLKIDFPATPSQESRPAKVPASSLKSRAKAAKA